jgi:parallel beta-helix repeat protein
VNEGKGTVDEDFLNGRGTRWPATARRRSTRRELLYLGFGDVSRTACRGVSRESAHITNSVIAHPVLRGLQPTRRPHDQRQRSATMLYGIDPHTGSHNLTIERNVVHDNGKHGIILAEDCVDSVIRDNVVYRNQHHGIVLYLHSDRNLIEDNETFNNAAQGININEASNNTIKSNRVYDNTESGIGIGQTAKDNVVQDNDVRGNQQDGLRLVSEASQTDVRGNVIGENVRYGVYVDSDGPFAMAGNTIWANRTGVMLKGNTTDPSSGNSIFSNKEMDFKNG